MFLILFCWFTVTLLYIPHVSIIYVKANFLTHHKAPILNTLNSKALLVRYDFITGNLSSQYSNFMLSQLPRFNARPCFYSNTAHLLFTSFSNITW